MSGLTDTTGIVALAAAAVAVVALLLALVLAVRLRRLRADQLLVLGEDPQDLVAHAAGLERDYEALSAYVEDAVRRVEERLARAEERLDASLTHHALVRYDAYGENSGRQSMSLALLDARRNGVVLSSILHRDTARFYARRIHEGEPESQLSPEEDEAVRTAVDRPPG